MVLRLLSGVKSTRGVAPGQLAPSQLPQVKLERFLDNRTNLILIRAFTVRKHDNSESTLTLCPGTEIFAAIGDTGQLVKLTFQSRPGFFVIDRGTLEISTRPLQ
jgi:hypothetical protein